MYRRTYKHEVKREEAIPTLLPRSRSSGCRSHERECRCGTQAATLPAKETHSRNPRHNWLEVIIAIDDCDARTPINQSINHSASRGNHVPVPHHATASTSQHYSNCSAFPLHSTADHTAVQCCARDTTPLQFFSSHEHLEQYN